MDCYFVQVALLKHPELINHPVGFASSDSYSLVSSMSVDNTVKLVLVITSLVLLVLRKDYGWDEQKNYVPI